LFAAVVASIPSPSSGGIQLGPVHLRAYGLMIALGVVAAVWLAGRRLEERGVGTREDVSYIALWAVPAGVIGSRLYHVATDWRRFQGHWFDVVKIWQGGLGIWGGIGLGVIVGVWVAWRRGIPLEPGLSAFVPALPLAQAIGRWGNWWNQELFGRPTDLPWALEVSPSKAIAAGFPAGTRFHPTFLYESLWCLFLCGALIWIDKRLRPTGYQLLAMYVAGYTFVRFWIERLRIDPATLVGGWRINEIVSLVVFGLAVLYLIVSYLRPRRPATASADGAVVEDELGDEPAGDAASAAVDAEEDAQSDARGDEDAIDEPVGVADGQPDDADGDTVDDAAAGESVEEEAEPGSEAATDSPTMHDAVIRTDEPE
jgi:phosphatidylglycerol---prolipoprotein diacylglyceryl transferase